jgi:hypothetical protein
MERSDRGLIEGIVLVFKGGKPRKSSGRIAILRTEM